MSKQKRGKNIAIWKTNREIYLFIICHNKEHKNKKKQLSMMYAKESHSNHIALNYLEEKKKRNQF